MRIKICGITNLKDALLASAYGAWAVGFIFYKKSPRFISPNTAAKIIAKLPPFVTPVGVFVNESYRRVIKTAHLCHLSALQFHGDEPPDYCQRFKGFKIIKAVRVQRRIHLALFKKYSVDAFLLDTYHEDLFGGTGKPFDWAQAKKMRAIKIPIILSGGLNPQNIVRAYKSVHPYAVDIASGVEISPGQKSPRLLKALFQKTEIS